MARIDNEGHITWECEECAYTLQARRTETMLQGRKDHQRVVHERAVLVPE